MLAGGSPVKLYTSSEWLEGSLSMGKDLLVWIDSTPKSVNKLVISKKAIFSVILTEKHTKAFKTIKEAAKISDSTKESCCFTIFTISRNDSSTNSNDNNDRPVCDSWSFSAKDHASALSLIKQIQVLIRPDYHSRQLYSLVLINHTSGKRKASKILKDFVEPVFKLGNVKYDIHETTGPDFAYDFMLSHDLSKYTSFCTISGDGLLHQMINGFLSRPDSLKFKQVPFAVIPAGSGNGLAWSVDCGWPELACISIVKNYSQPMDLMAITRPNHPLMFCFLSVTYGYVADVDIESEKFRAFGSARMDIYGVLRLLSLRQYNAKIHYLPANKSVELNQNFSTSSVPVINGKQINYITSVNGIDPPTDGNLKLENGTNPQNEFSVHQPSPLKNSTSPSDSVNSSSGSSLLKSSDMLQSSRPHGLPSLKSAGISLPVDKALLPQNWVSLEGSFTFINILNAPWLSKSFLSCQSTDINDGVIDLIWSTSKSRSKLLPYFTGSQNPDSMFDNVNINHEKITSIIIEPEKRAKPLTPTSPLPESNPQSQNKPYEIVKGVGIYSLDGEAAPVDFIKIDLVPSFVKIMTSPWFENPRNKRQKSKTPRADSKAALFSYSAVSKSNSTEFSK
ncbi:hypothetical protein BB560_001818 [Smittium megazygosporum]|uniref:DAGKc domain-containing protein n=1 Tax=Smittium megazygosporum TaxID=133381 RepID=A0A2T9ZGQ8_9FUNG|nr:hypothetical protein BB560_001818 [Smittium megazygosporum]